MSVDSSTKQDEQIRYEEIACQALEGIANNEPIPEIDIDPHVEPYVCDHTPDLLQFIGTIERAGHYINLYRCTCCGEEFEECRQKPSLQLLNKT